MAGSAGERYIYPCRDTRPRGIQNWIGAYDDKVSVILSSSVVVADYIDPTDNPLPGPVLQPVLLASRKSCPWEGNDYLQTGNHSFRFSLTSTQPDWRKGYKPGLQANEKLIAVVARHQYLDASLPEERSFFSLDQSNVMVTTLKKAEDEPSAVVRLVEMEGQNSEAGIESYFRIEKIAHTNLTEEPVRELKITGKISLPVGHHAIETFKFR
jgi:alpha-mannosidase